ncbi:MAG: hypothetical protein OXC27_03295 [Caldilineaceae bacterium]|nr:hypothetical protein [Caldilineaceae bacterium]
MRFFIDPDTDEPHIYVHGVEEDEVEDILFFPGEDDGVVDSHVLQSDERVGGATFV